MTVSRDSIPTRHQRILTEALLILELTHGIVELIDYIPTLLVLRRISKLFQYESERLLYRSMAKQDGFWNQELPISLQYQTKPSLVRLFHGHTIIQK